MYVIHLTPKNKNFKPHVWKEGGEFETKEKADGQAKQLRKMKGMTDGRQKMYDRVDVIPVMAHTYDKVSQKQIKEAVALGYVVFYNIKWDTDGYKVKLPKAIQVRKEQFEEDFDFSLEGANYLSDEYGYCIHSFSFKAE